MDKIQLQRRGGGNLFVNAYLANRGYMYDSEKLNIMYKTMVYRIVGMVGLCNTLCCNVDDVLRRRNDKRFERDRKAMMRYIEAASNSLNVPLHVSADYIKDLNYKLYTSHKRNIESLYSCVYKRLKDGGSTDPELCSWLAILMRFAAYTEQIYKESKDVIFGLTKDSVSITLKNVTLDSMRKVLKSVINISVIQDPVSSELANADDVLIKQFLSLMHKVVDMDNYVKPAEYARTENGM